MIEVEVLDELKRIGLNLYERKLYVALLAKKVASAGELSEMAGVPRSRSYDVLESLAEKGFVVIQPSKPIKFVALPPREALERTKQNLQKKHEELIEKIEKLKNSDAINKLEQLYNEGIDVLQPTDMLGCFKGKHSINQHLQFILKNAKENVDMLLTEDGLNELFSVHFNTLKKLNKNGVKIRIAAPLSDNEAVRNLSQIAELRHIDSPMGRILMIDNQHLMFALTNDKEVHSTQDVAFWTSSSHAVRDVLGNFFERVWNSSQPYNI